MKTIFKIVSLLMIAASIQNINIVEFVIGAAILGFCTLKYNLEPENK